MIIIINKKRNLKKKSEGAKHSSVPLGKVNDRFRRSSDLKIKQNIS